MTLLNREAILSTNDLPYNDVFVTEWDGSVRIRAMTGVDRDLYQKEFNESEVKDYNRIRAFVVYLTAVDEDGNRIFNKEDVDDINQKNTEIIDGLFDAARRLSGLAKDEAEHEETVKNSKATDGEDSSIG